MIEKAIYSVIVIYTIAIQSMFNTPQITQMVFENREVEIHSIAEYSVTGYVKAIGYKKDNLSFFSPVDVTLASGMVASEKFLIYQTGRYATASTNSKLVDEYYIATHLYNNHLVFKNKEDINLLRDIKIGDIVTIKGKLIDVWFYDLDNIRYIFKTSLVRDDGISDIGNGCEIILVDDIIKVK